MAVRFVIFTKISCFLAGGYKICVEDDPPHAEVSYIEVYGVKKGESLEQDLRQSKLKLI